MDKCIISINQYADFIKSSDAKKKRIIKDQKKPNKFRIAYYQLAKARIRKTLIDNGKLKHIDDALQQLTLRVPKNKRQISDKHVSIQALEKFLKLQIPKVLKGDNIEFLNPKNFKSDIEIHGLSIIVAPEIIFKVNINGQDILGGLKLHVSKSNSFDFEQQRIIASAVCNHLERNVAIENQIVLPEFCISLDVFGNGYILSTTANKNVVESYQKECLEIIKIWDAA